MHLSSLTLKGFKSFASATTLRLEPGITAVVGPNGSGKSNVVDAIAWVLGEQGAKSLRGGKMEDVIFAGTAGRPALGRAEVTLTIDNADGALPIAYTEVSITRRMYRSGESEYEINGDKVRLLDVQELLSDSGIGREMHVIVGQGQLDAVLSGRPEDRRAFIEEAAGVLKHRKRKEKALRKLEGMQAQPRPARRPHHRAAPPAHAAGQSRPRSPAAPPACSPTCATPGCGCWPTTWCSCATPSTGTSPTRRRAREQRAAGRARALRRLAARVSARERAGRRARRCCRAPPTPGTGSRALTERFRGIAQLAAERHRHLSAAAPAAAPGRDPDQLDAEADRVAATEAELADRPRRRARPARRPSSPRAPSWRRRSPRPRRPGSRPPARSPTAARAWPGSPARSPRHGRG